MDQGLLRENLEYMQWSIRRTGRYISREWALSTEVVNLPYNFKKFLILLFIIISNFVNLNHSSILVITNINHMQNPMYLQCMFLDLCPNIIHHKHNINQQVFLVMRLKDVNKVFNHWGSYHVYLNTHFKSLLPQMFFMAPHKCLPLDIQDLVILVLML